MARLAPERERKLIVRALKRRGPVESCRMGKLLRALSLDMPEREFVAAVQELCDDEKVRLIEGDGKVRLSLT